MSKKNDAEEIQKEQMMINNYLSLSRTQLSIERTLLSYIRTGLTFSVAGLSFIQFFEHLFNKLSGGLLIVIGLCLVMFGYIKYRKMKQIIKNSTLKLKSIKRLEDVL